MNENYGKSRALEDIRTRKAAIYKEEKFDVRWKGLKNFRLSKANTDVTYCDVLAVGNRATVECDVNNMADERSSRTVNTT
jgi:hypothetical protein